MLIVLPVQSNWSPFKPLALAAIFKKPLQPWDFFGRNDAKAETPVLWPPYAKS